MLLLYLSHLLDLANHGTRLLLPASLTPLDSASACLDLPNLQNGTCLMGLLILLPEEVNPNVAPCPHNNVTTRIYGVSVAIKVVNFWG